MSTIETRIMRQIDRAEARWGAVEGKVDDAMHYMERARRGEQVDWRQADEPARIQRRLARLGQESAADAMVSGAAAAFNPLERIIDANNLTGIGFFERGVLAARAVARVRIRGASGFDSGFGSGVLISPQLFMTNNHVLPDAGTAGASEVEFGYIDTLLGPRDPQVFALEPGRFFVTDEERDFTIVAVEPENAAGQRVARRGWCPLIAGSGKAISGERVNIIQHPSGERMQLAIRDNTIIAPEGHFLLYKADTQPGSSGSPVFNDQWEMAALHHAGVPRRDPQNRILMRNGQPWTRLPQDIARIDWIGNEGVRISKIVEHVRGLGLPPERRALFDGAFRPPEPIDIWSRIEGSAGAGPGATERADGPFEQGVDADGTPYWLFKLSFGPVPRDGRASAAAPRPTMPQPQVPVPQIPMADAGGAAGAEDEARALARDIAERFAPPAAYHDAEADAAERDAYWQGVALDGPSAEQFAALTAHLAATHTTPLSYSKARHEFLYPSVDLRPDGGLRSVYSDAPMDPVETIAAELALLVPRARARGMETASPAALERVMLDESLWNEIEAEATTVPFNCEHVVPQSWFQKENPAKGDLHHLFSCEPDCNSFRSNLPYWQFPPEDEAVRERCGRRESGDQFEPAAGKGPAARATMYFLMRYPGEIGDGDGPNEMPKSRLRVLLEWHRAEPPGEYERHRNWLIARAQGNRNPFIDFPDLARDALVKRGFG